MENDAESIRLSLKSWSNTNRFRSWEGQKTTYFEKLKKKIRVNVQFWLLRGLKT